MPNRGVNRLSYWWSRERPPSGSVPRFPIWEVMIMLYVVIYGLLSFQSPSDRLEYVLSGYGYVWSSAILLSGLLCLTGLLLPILDGFVVNLVGSIILFVATTSVIIGLAYLEGTFFFGNSLIALATFSIGSLLRSIQLTNHLRKMRTIMEVKARYGRDRRDGGC